MKAAVLTSLFIAFLFVSNISAQRQGSKVLANIETTEAGVIKEFVEVDKETLKPFVKTTYQYDANNNIQAKICCNWDEVSGWVNEKKYEYEYNRAGKIKNLVYTEWDEKQQAWSNQSERFLHVYDSHGKLQSVKSVHTNKTQWIFIAVM